jgi:hypothetical protein
MRTMHTMTHTLSIIVIVLLSCAIIMRIIKHKLMHIERRARSRVRRSKR